MACSSITAITRLCGTAVIPGTEKMWMVAFKDLYNISGTDVYTVGTSSNLVNAIGLTGSKKFVEIQALRDSSGFDSAFTIDPTKGVRFSTNTLTFKLGDLTVENQLFVDTVVGQPVAAILKLRTGRYYVLGLGGLMEATGAQGTSGKSSGDEINYTLTFNEVASGVPYQVDPTIITTVTA